MKYNKTILISALTIIIGLAFATTMQAENIYLSTSLANSSGIQIKNSVTKNNVIYSTSKSETRNKIRSTKKNNGKTIQELSLSINKRLLSNTASINNQETYSFNSVDRFYKQI